MTKKAILTASRPNKIRKKVNQPKSFCNFVVSTSKIMYIRNWIILIKIEGLDTISVESFVTIFVAESAKK